MRPLQALNPLLRRLGLSLRRLPVHRFDGLDDALAHLADRGYAPRRVIDAGANLGQWARRALPTFPAAAFDLIEPQPACAPALAALAQGDPRITVHSTAVTAPGVERLRMVGGGEERTGSGAHIALADELSSDEIEVPATTFDQLFAERVTRADRVLLKLDLEGHELDALSGAPRLLAEVEVVLTEVQFYEVNANGRPCFTQVAAFLAERGFELYDFAALAGRPRDGRLRMGDVLFVRGDSPLATDVGWE